MSAHTKGEWLLAGENNDFVYALGPNGGNSFWAAVSSAGSDRISDEEKAANARLMAAAPSLLQAASDAYARLLSLGDYTGRCTMKGQCELASLVDAIAKATGRENQEVQEEFEEREIMRKYK